MTGATEGILPNHVRDEPSLPVRALLKHVSPDEIPAAADLLSAAALEQHLRGLADPPFSLVAVGDIMLGGRARRVLAERGADYPFETVLPLLRRAAIVLGNLEGPFARKARRRSRNFSYRVDPDLAGSLARAGVSVVTLANNHLLDCGRAGVMETLDALRCAGVAAVGAGINETAAHAAVIRQAGRFRVGFLGYYWNRRCAATGDLPGSALDPPAALETDIRRLKDQADRVVVTFHWGVPYLREPSAADRAKARHAVDCGADVVVGHHPHIVQPLEIHRGCPIFYSIGNFMLGSGNSRAEGLVLGCRFEEHRTEVTVFPLYVKNRDPRVNYQPKVLGGKGAERVLGRLAEISGPSAEWLRKRNGQGRLDLPWPGARRREEVLDV